MIQLKGKNAFVTGSSRGVGQQIAIGLARLGCNIIVHGRTKKACATTLKLLKKHKVSTYCVRGELSKEHDVLAIVEQIKALNIPVDILYNNAAIMSPFQQNIWDHSWDAWMDSFKVNVFAMYTLCGAFIPGMIERGYGRVINTTSGIKDLPELAPYGASKWAVNKLTDDIASKLTDTGVSACTLDPGWLRTDLGGPDAEHDVEAVIPGALAPVLFTDKKVNAKFFSAINHDIDFVVFKNELKVKSKGSV